MAKLEQRRYKILVYRKKKRRTYSCCGDFFCVFFSVDNGFYKFFQLLIRRVACTRKTLKNKC